GSPAAAPAKPTAGSAPAPAATAPAASAPSGAATTPPAAPPERAVVRVAHIGATISDSPLYIADDRGYLAEEGLELDRTVFDSAARMIPALAADQVDVGGGAISAGLFNAVGRGVDLRIVADKGSMQPGDRWNSI